MKQRFKDLKWLLLSFFWVVPFSVQAQQTTLEPEVTSISGIVTDKNKTPVGGVTVEVQEKQNIATTTGPDGKFTVAATINDVLIFRKAGYLTAQFSVSAHEDFTVALEEAKINAGDEDDVEIPFGVRKKRYLTAATSSLKAEDLPQPSTSALTNIFSGRLAGLTVLQSNTQPGADVSTFRVRGRSSFENANALVLIDGIEREFQDLDLNEIESITVLKDAATLAFYGLRGSNGVVLVTTKKGSSTKSSIRFDSQFGFQRPDHLIKPLNSYEYATLYNEAYMNDRTGQATPFYSQAALDAYQKGTDPYLFPNNNYVEQFIRKSTPIQRHVLSVQGGSARVRYFALLGYLNQQGLFKGTDGPDYNSNNAYKRYNFRGNVDFDVTNSLTVSVNLAGRAENRVNTGSGNNTVGILNNIYTLRPNAYPLLNKDGSFGGNAEFTRNILGNITANGLIRRIQRVGLANISATQKLDALVKGLSAQVLISYDAQGDYTSGYTQNYQVFDFTGTAPQIYGTEANLNYLSSPFNTQLRTNEIWAGFDYNRTVGVHQVNATLRGMRSEYDDFFNTKQRIQGLSARIEYSFKQKYLLSLVAGYSGDDDFPAGNRYGFFPAVSAGWIISDEDFLSNSSFISFLKARASYGKSGNNDLSFGRRFPYRSYYDRNITSGGYQFGTGFSATNSASELNIANPYVTWETLTSTNLGLDFNLISNTLSGSIDVYKNKRTGILTTAAIPAIIGPDLLSNVNEGAVESKGIEGALWYNKEIGAFKLSLNANVLVAKDKVLAQNGQEGLPSYQSSIGMSAGSGLYYLSDGLYQNQSEVAAGPKSTLAGAIFPGDIRYKDINGDGKIDNSDRVRLNLGSPAYWGFGTDIRYKLFDFNAQFQGVFHRKLNIQSLLQVGPNNLNRESFNRFTPATAGTALYPRLSLSNRGNNTVSSDFWLRSASYLKLKTVEFGVNLPEQIANRFRMQSFRLYVSAFNPITFTKLDFDVDPELPFAGQVAGYYPYVKTYSVGLGARF